ncbi:MAG: Smr/MutS family protein [Nitrospinae bacterium]|nr:Smr/MutS family protein [Nitrospinota bacterium]
MTQKPRASGATRAAKALEFGLLRDALAAHCRTEAGAGLCRELLPAAAREEAEHLLDETVEMLPLLKGGGLLFPNAIPDPAPALARVKRGAVPEKDDCKIMWRFLRGAERLDEFLRDNPDKAALHAAAAGFVSLEEITAFFSRTFSEDGGVKPDATALLMELESRIAALRGRIHKKAEEMLTRAGLEGRFQDTYVTIRNDRVVLPVKAEFKNVFPGIIHGISATDKTVFMEPQELVKENNALREAAAERDEEIYRLLREAAAMLRENADTITACHAAMARLDAVAAKAAVSLAIGGTRPAFAPGGIAMRAVRHPLMLLAGEKPLPNDLLMTQQEKVLVISGPNAGGKTVMLKSVGLAALLAQSGVLPPVGEGSRFPFVEKLHAIAGDEQSIAEGESTFSAQLRGIKEALETAGPGTWVIIDEILNGTDPAQASALAQAVLEDLAAKDCRVFVSTHLPQLKVAAQENPALVNAAMGFGADGRPTFHLAKGHPGVSHPLDVAAAIGISASVMEKAKSLLSSTHDIYQVALLDLQKKSDEMRRRVAELEQEKAGAEAERARLQREREAAERAKDAFERDKKQRLKDEVAKARAELRAMLEETRTQDTKAKEEAARRLKEMETEMVAAIKRPDSVPLEHLKQGDAVWILPLDREAQLAKITDDGKVEVFCRGLRMTLGRDEVIGIKEKAALDAAPARRMMLPAAEEAPEINLIGMTGEDACEALDKFLDSQLLAGAERVKIVHGRAIVRGRVLDYLKTCSYVKGYGPGAAAEGGDAVTLAELKD